MKTIIKYLFVAAAMAATALSCEEDDALPDIKDIFRPVFINAKASDNQVSYVWHPVDLAVDYSVEIYRDEAFTILESSGVTADNKYISADMPFATTLYARVKANASDPRHSSAWSAAPAVNTEPRQNVPAPLLAVEESDINETTVTLRWTVNSDYPVDSISVAASDRTLGLADKGFKLTSAQSAAGSLLVEGLRKNTDYVASAYNTAKGKYEKLYNERPFTTAGMPDGYTEVTPDTFDAELAAQLADISLPAVQLYLTPGNYSITTASNLIFTKSVYLMGDMNNRPALSFANGQSCSLNTDKTKAKATVSFKNLILTTSNGYLINTTNAAHSFRLSRLVFENCEMRLAQGLYFTHLTNITGCDIDEFEIKNCYLNNTPGSNQCLINARGDNNAFADFKMTNSTVVMNPAFTTGGMNYTFGHPRDVKFTFTSVTFYNNNSGAYLWNFTKNSASQKVDVTFTKCLFSGLGYTRALQRVASDAIIFGFSQNYRTEECIMPATAHFTFPLGSEPAATLPTADLITKASSDPAEWNLTIKALDSPVCTWRIGDPRWLPAN